MKKNPFPESSIKPASFKNKLNSLWEQASDSQCMKCGSYVETTSNYLVNLSIMSLSCYKLKDTNN